ncbi:MAG: FUSC family protein [Proteobacteria bacterium]|nr:FUSC family protein [Pseudomonadota bacterium]
MTFVETISRLGFDPPRLRFGVRTAMAACLALLVSWLMGLEHPQWSAMTVWAASQPTPGPLIEKSFFRAIGTVVGALVGVLIVAASGGEPLLLAPALAAWVGLCAGAGNLLRGFISYGTLLAGYSASMVALLNADHPGHIVALGIDRTSTVLVGVLVALLVGLAFGTRQADEIVGRSRRLTARVLRDMAASLDGAARDVEREQHAILAEMAAIDEGLDPHGAGSLRSRRSARTMRSILVAQVAALLWLRRHDGGEVDRAVAAALRRAADALERNASPSTLVGTLEEAEALTCGHGALHRAVAGLAAAIRDRMAFRDQSIEPPAARHPVVLHRDWITARHTLLRTFGTLLAVGALWVATGWSGGAYVMLGTTVMLSLFSTFDTPAAIMRHVLIGQIFGAAAAIACRWLVWPAAENGLQLVLLMMPFVLFGALPFAHRRTTASGTDFNMILLLLLQPAFPLSGTIGHFLGMAAGVIAAPIIALAAFRLVLPTDPRRRMDRLVTMMVHELQSMAADGDAARHEQVWRARLCHRLLTLVRWMEKADARKPSAAAGSMTVMQLAECVRNLHDLATAPDLPRPVRRRAIAALARLRRIGRDPVRARYTLDRMASTLSRAKLAGAGLYAGAARALSDNMAFFSRTVSP